MSVIGDYLQVLPARALRAVTAPLPYEWRVELGGRLAQAAVALSPAQRQRIEHNLRHAMPELGPEARRALRTRIARNLGRTLFEFYTMPAFVRRSDRIDVVGDGLAAVHAAKARGDGAILVGGHFGNWEAVRAAAFHQGLRIAALYRPQNNRFFDRDFLACLTATGGTAFPKGRDGFKDMLRHLKGGGLLAILADQRVKGGPKLSFLGQPAATTTTPADLALKYKVPLIPAFGTRRGRRLVVEVEDPIPHGDRREMAQALNDRLSARIRRDPDQWLWTHRRWR